MEQQLDIRKTEPILTPSGGKIWHSGVLLRKASRFLTGLPHDSVIPIDVFYDAETGKICREGLPLELLGMLGDEE